MGEETARLRAEIDQTRENLTRDVDLLAEKTSPSKIVERRVERTKRGISGLKDKVMGAMPGSDDDEYSYTRLHHGYGSGYGNGESGGQGFVGNATSTVSGGVSSAAGTVGSAAGSAKESVTGAVSNATSTVGDAASSVGDAAHGAVGTVKEQAEGNPLAAGLVAFGVGWLVSSLMPASEAEQRAARRAVEQAKNAPWSTRSRPPPRTSPGRRPPHAGVGHRGRPAGEGEGAGRHLHGQGRGPGRRPGRQAERPGRRAGRQGPDPAARRGGSQRLRVERVDVLTHAPQLH